MKPKDESCSFCGRWAKEVKDLIAGPEVFICDECISLCVGIIKERRAEETKIDKESKLDDFLSGRDGVLLTDLEVPNEVLQLIPKPDLLFAFGIFPIALKGKNLFLAMDARKGYNDQRVKDGVNFMTDRDVVLVKVPGEHIKIMLDRYYPISS